MRFFAYYCNDNSNNIITEAESGSYIQVVFNNVFASGMCEDVGVFKLTGNLLLRYLKKITADGRIDFYEMRAKSNNDDTYTSKHDYIIIRNSDKPVFIPITRQEYLQQMLKDIETYRTKRKKEISGNLYRTGKAV